MKNLRIIFLTLLCMVSLSLPAQLKDKTLLDIETADLGKTVKLTVKLQNIKSRNYTAFQMDIKYPSTFEYVDYSLEKSLRLLGHMVTVAQQRSNTIRITAISTNNSEITGRTGELFSLIIKAKPNAIRGEHIVYNSNIVFTKRDGTEVEMPKLKSNFDFVPYDDLQSYNLIYMLDDSTEYKRVTLKEGQQVTPMENPFKDGHTFVGWKDEPTIMPSADHKVFADFTVNSYIVSYYLNNVIYAEQEVKFGAPIVPPVVKETPGQRFMGWSDYPETMPSRNINIFGYTEATGIEALTATSKVNVYNLQGLQLLSDVTLKEAQQKLPKGIYIVNGQRLYIK